MYIIRLNNFPTLFFFSFLFLFILITNGNSKPFCEGKIPYNPFIKNFYPEKIDIQISKSQKWYNNYLKIVSELGDSKWKDSKRISPKFKKNFTGNVRVYYKNNIFCDFNAKIRVHGGRGDHVDNMNSSLNVKLLDGHINNNSHFILFVPNSRNSKDEIFIATLLEDLKILSPNTFYTNVKLNDHEYYKYIFQEKINQQFLHKNNKFDNIIMLGNKSWQIYEKFPDLRNKDIQLSRFYNDDLRVKPNNILQAIDILNYHFLNNVETLRQSKTYKDNFIMNAQELEYAYNFIDYEKNYFKKNYINFAIYDALLLSNGAIAGLTIFDRKYVYDIFENQIYPIYYDGMANIFKEKFSLQNKKFKNKKIFNHHKIGAEYLKNYFKDFDIESFKNKLSEKNVKIESEELSSAIKILKQNIDILTKLDVLEVSRVSNQNYFKEVLSKSKNLKIVFGGTDNIFLACDVAVNLKTQNQCNQYFASKEESLSILSNQLTNVKFGNLFYVRKSLDKYLKNAIPGNYGLETFKYKKIDQKSKIYKKYESTKINIIPSEKIININTLESNERIVVVSEKLDKWRFNYNGSFFQSILRNTRAHPTESSFQACLEFLNTNLQNVKISVKNANCPDALHFLNTKGNIDEITVKNSFYDAVDADNSNLSFKKITVENAGQECLGLKSGKYFVKNYFASNCKDKAVSVGEKAKLNIENSTISDSKYGLVSKDSGTIIAKKTEIKDTLICLSAYRDKINFEGGYLSVKKINAQCKKKERIEKGSVLN